MNTDRDDYRAPSAKLLLEWFEELAKRPLILALPEVDEAVQTALAELREMQGQTGRAVCLHIRTHMEAIISALERGRLPN